MLLVYESPTTERPRATTTTDKSHWVWPQRNHTENEQMNDRCDATTTGLPQFTASSPAVSCRRISQPRCSTASHSEGTTKPKRLYYRYMPSFYRVALNKQRNRPSVHPQQLNVLTGRSSGQCGRSHSCHLPPPPRRDQINWTLMSKSEP